MKRLIVAAVLLCTACGGHRAPSAPPPTVNRSAQMTPAPPPPPAPPDTGVQPYQHPIFRIPPSSRGAIVQDPEVPARIIKKVPPKYTSVALKAGIRGIAIVAVVVETDGHVSAARVLKPLPFGLDQSAVECVRQWHFEPARAHGLPVRSIYDATIRFQPPK